MKWYNTWKPCYPYPPFYRSLISLYFFIKKDLSKPNGMCQIFYQYSLLTRSIKIETLARFIFEWAITLNLLVSSQYVMKYPSGIKSWLWLKEHNYLVFIIHRSVNGGVFLNTITLPAAKEFGIVILRRSSRKIGLEVWTSKVRRVMQSKPKLLKQLVMRIPP